jgi:hypothetical protein
MAVGGMPGEAGMVAGVTGIGCAGIEAGACVGDSGWVIGTVELGTSRGCEIGRDGTGAGDDCDEDEDGAGTDCGEFL